MAANISDLGLAAVPSVSPWVQPISTTLTSEPTPPLPNMTSSDLGEVTAVNNETVIEFCGSMAPLAEPYLLNIKFYLQGITVIILGTFGLICNTLAIATIGK